MKSLEKNLACNGTLVPDPELGEVIHLQGDQGTNVVPNLIS
jgi:translation initiation factor 1 (eIF-1/SUI1)